MDEEWVPLAEAVSQIAQGLDLSINLARRALQREAWPAGVVLASYHPPININIRLSQDSAGQILTNHPERYVEIDLDHLTVLEIDWKNEELTAIPSNSQNTDQRPLVFSRLHVNAADLEKWLTAKGAKPNRRQATRKTDSQRDAAVRLKIATVLRHWREWPPERKAKNVRQQARLLHHELKGKVDFSENTLRDILRKTYRPMIRLGIVGPAPGLRKPAKRRKPN
jgi:hypothetical protein